LSLGNFLPNIVLWISGFLLSLLFPTIVAADDGIKNAIVKLYTVTNSFNYHEPWAMKGQKTLHGSGSIISQGRILTNAHVVSDQMFLQVRRGGQAKKYTAKVEIVGHESDLAIVRVEDSTFFYDVTPLAIGELPETRDYVSVYGFPNGGDKLSLTEGIVSRIEHTKYAHSGAYLLTGQIDAPINLGNSGGPVIKDGKIVGVAFQSLRNDTYENIGYMVPAPVIQHFLEDIEDGIFDGTPDIGIAFQDMENPALRERMLMNKEQTGVLVSRIYPDSPVEGILEIGDVLLSIDGEKIENDGTIEFRKGERTAFYYVMQRKQLQSRITLRILRQGKEQHLNIPLTKPVDFERLVPQRQYDKPATYYIKGGLVFEPLTLNYLMDFGKNWNMVAPLDLLNFYDNGRPQPDRREVVILVKVLADEINIGYHEKKNVIVSLVNGKPVSTIHDLVHAFETHKGDYYVVEDNYGYKITLSRKKTEEAHAKILQNYKISADRSEDLQP